MTNSSSVRQSGRATHYHRVLLLIGAVLLIGTLTATSQQRTDAQTAASTTSPTAAATRITSTPSRTATPSKTPTPSATPTATDTPTTSNTPTPSDTATHVGLPISIWYGWQGDDADRLQLAIDAYQAAHGDLNITSQAIDLSALTPTQFLARLSAAQRTGQLPAMLIMPAAWIIDLDEAGLIAALPVSSLTTIRPSLAPAAWNAVTDRGTIYGVPLAVNCVSLIANPPLATSDPQTADALIKLPNIAVAFDFYDTAGLYFGQGGTLAQLTSVARHTQTDPPAALISYLSALHDWYALTSVSTPIPYPTSIGNVPTAEVTSAIPLPADIGFRLGAQPYVIADNGALPVYESYLKFPRFVPFPKFSAGGTWQPLVESQAIALTTHDPAVRSAAIGLISALTDAKTQIALSGGAYLPVNTDAATQFSDQNLVQASAQCQTGIFPSPQEARLLRLPLLDNAIFAVTVGGQAPAQAASRLVAQLVPTTTPTITPTPSPTLIGG